MAVYVSRQVDLATASAWQTATAMAGETRNDVIVPPGMNSIKQIWMTLAQSATFTTTTGALVAMRIRGLGRTYETLAGGISNGTIATKDGLTVSCPATIIDTNLAVVPGQNLTLEGCQVTGSDCGAPTLGITLVFDASGGAARSSFFRYVSSATVDAKAGMTLDAVNATVNQIQYPGNVRHITNVVVAIGGITGTAALGGTGLVRLEGSLKEGDLCITAGGQASLDTNDGAGTMVWNAYVMPTDIPIDAMGTSMAYFEQCGVDWGTPYGGIAVEVE
jgi:hypothetical protein